MNEDLQEKDVKKRHQILGVDESRKIFTDFWITHNSDKVNENILLDKDVKVVNGPDKILCAWVYSDVDEKTERVTGYVIRGCHLSEDEVEITKEELLQLMQEHPELKA